MQAPSHKALLKELDSLGYGARIARVARLGRDTKGTPALEALLSALEQGDTYEALLALELARGSGDEARLLRALLHPSLEVRCRAAACVPFRVRDDAAIERALPSLSPDGRRRLLKGVVRARRTALAARLFTQRLAQHAPAEAALLLPALDAAALEAALPALGHRVRGSDRIAARQPDAVLRYLRALFASTPERERSSLFSFFHPALVELAASRGAEVLALAREFSPPDELPWPIQARLRLLSRRQPEHVFALLTRPTYLPRLLQRGLPTGVLRELRGFTSVQRLTLARLLADAPAHLAALLGALPPSQRASLFEHAFDGVAMRLLPDSLLEVLPHAARDAQAARMLGLREVQESRARTLELHSFRAIETARAPLAQAALAAKAEERAQALALLVHATGRSRRGLTETLAQLSRLKNEQDPVRLAALDALARKVPPSVFKPEHVPALEQLADWVVEARDTSGSTRNALQALAFRLMRANAAAPDGPLFQLGLSVLKKLARQADALALPPLADNLPRGAEVRIVAALLPTIRAAATRESHGLVLALAGALGRRGWKVDLLQPLVEQATEASPDWVARNAITLWLAPPRTRDARVRKLLDRDESTIAAPYVFEHLHRRRQEWLDPFLKGRAISGRFLAGKAGYLPPARGGFHTWLPRQQRALAALLTRIAADASRATWERAGVLHTLARMPALGLNDLLPFTRHAEVPIAEAALGALAWLDKPDGALAPLLEHLDTDRARVAMYSIPRVARLIPGGALAAALEALLGREKLRVTVHKEAVRMLGTFRLEQSLPLLRREADKPNLHRDVRIAVGHAARQLLDLPDAWALLDGMARSPDADVARSLLEQDRSALPPDARPRYVALLLQVARHPELEVRRQAFQVLPAWSAGAEEQVAEAAAERVLDLAGGAEWREAAQALVQAARDGKAGARVVATAEALGRPGPEALEATADRDSPGRQRLLSLCEALRGLPRPVLLRSKPLLLEVAQVVAADATLWTAGARLRLCTVEWRDAEGAVELLSRLGAEAREEPLFTVALAQETRQSLEAAATEWTPAGLLAAADRLVEEAPLLALPFVAVAGERLRWDAEAARRLRALREHPRLAVRAAARAVFTAAE